MRGRRINQRALAVLLMAWIGREVSSRRVRTGTLQVTSTCGPRKAKDRKVIVDSMSLLCDSRTAGYNDKASCLSGDKAKLRVEFRIQQMSGNISIGVGIETEYFSYRSTIHNRTNLCEFRSLYYKEGSHQLYQPSCPLVNGRYALFTTFNIPSYGQDPYMSFTPDIHLQFFNTLNGNRLACVETGALVHYMDRERSGVKVFVGFIFLFIVIFALCLIGHHRKKKRNEKFHIKRQASIMRRYHYMRTTRNGAVVIPNLATSGSAGTLSMGDVQTATPAETTVAQMSLPNLPPDTTPAASLMSSYI